MARVATTTTGLPRSWQQFDPFRTVYRLLTSVRVALILLATVIVGALLGVVFPQAPDEVRIAPIAYDQYVEFQRGRYGVFVEPMRRLGLFEVFHSFWFNGVILVLLLAVAVCTANRIPPIVRNVRRPVRRVNDRFFERAHHRAEFTTPAEPAALVTQLRKRRYRVEAVQREGATYLFADRFPWAQFGTFVSHLSLILFMSGAIVTKVVGFSAFISIPEQQTQPVFSTIHTGQMQVENLGAAETLDAAGNVTRYHSDLAVYRNGRRICTGTSTVNNPLHCAGYVLHQTTFSPDGMALQVRDTATGQVIYHEVVAAGGRAPSPHLVVNDATGGTLFDDNVVLVPFDPQGSEFYAVLPIARGEGAAPAAPMIVALAAVPSGKNGWALRVFHARGATPSDGQFEIKLLPGESAQAGGYTFSFPALNGVPIAGVAGVPGVPTAAMLQLATSAKGEHYLDLVDMQSQQLGIGAGDPAPDAPAAPGHGQPAPAGAPPAVGRLDLAPNQPQVVNGLEYTFLGSRSITGITVRRDPGSTFIWVATALMMIGLAITFYLPRRRLWVRITPERTYMAGVADRIVNFAAEMHRIGAAAGSPDAAPAAEEW